MKGRDAQRQQLEALVEIGRVLVSTGDYERVLATMIATVSERMGAESAGFCLYDPERNELALQRPAFGLHDDSIIEQFRISLTGGSRTQKVFTDRQPFI